MSELKVGDTVSITAQVANVGVYYYTMRLLDRGCGTMQISKSDVAAWNTRATPPLMQVTESGAKIVGEWVSVVPSVEGHYWAIHGNCTEIVSVFPWGDDLVVGISQDEETPRVTTLVAHGWEFCGPLTPPAPPKEVE